MVSVPSRLTAAHRKLHTATGSKSDPTDARPQLTRQSPLPAWTGTASTNTSENSGFWSTTAPMSSNAAPMVINQLKAQQHIWLDHTPGDLSRAKALTTLTARLDTASLSGHVGQALTEMITEITDLNRRVHDLDTTIRELFTPWRQRFSRSLGSAMTLQRC